MSLSLLSDMLQYTNQQTTQNTWLTCPTVAYSVTRSTALQRFLYGNAGFAKLSAIEGLDNEKWRFDVRPHEKSTPDERDREREREFVCVLRRLTMR